MTPSTSSDVTLGRRELLAQIIVDVLQKYPGRDKRQLARRIARDFGMEVDTSELNSVLYARPDLFWHLGGQPPGWFAHGDPLSRVGSAVPVVSATSSSSGVRTLSPGSKRKVALLGPPPREWQRDALRAWKKAGGVGIVEAVTGTGKTRLAILAAHRALRRHERVAVVVPTLDLLDQWVGSIQEAMPAVKVGRLGGGHQDTLTTHEVLVATVQSASQRVFDSTSHRTLLVADEVHRYGAEVFALALEETFQSRLGITATLERSDDGVEGELLPYFNRVVFRCGFERALRDGVLSRFRVALAPIRFEQAERAKYDRAEKMLREARHRLVIDFDCAAEPFGRFMLDVQVLASGPRDEGRDVAQQYLGAFNKRRQTVAEAARKFAALQRLSAVVGASSRTLVFTETKAGARRAAETLREVGIASLDMSSDDDRERRRMLLESLRDGEIKALCAPRLLDEGIDVPDANVGIIVASSRTRRQMIQRMGRVLRVREGKSMAHFIVLYVEDSMEDPDNAHDETFLAQITDHAATVEVVDPLNSKAVARWLLSG